jgi:hypothetical protein
MSISDVVSAIVSREPAATDLVNRLQTHYTDFFLATLAEVVGDGPIDVAQRASALMVATCMEARRVAANSSLTFEWLAFGVAEAAKRSALSGYQAGAENARFDALLAPVPYLFSAGVSLSAACESMLDVMTVTMSNGHVPSNLRAKLIQAIAAAFYQSLYNTDNVIGGYHSFTPPRVASLVKGVTSAVTCGPPCDEMLEALGQFAERCQIFGPIHDLMPVDLVPFVISFCGRSFRCSEAIAHLASINAEAFLGSKPKETVDRILSVMKDPQFPLKNRLNTAWSLGRLIEQYPRVLEKRKLMAKAILQAAIDLVVEFAPRMTKLYSNTSFAQLEGDCSCLTLVDQLSKCAGAVVPGWGAVAAGAVASLVSSAKWEERFAAIAVCMYAAEGCQDAFATDRRIVAALETLIDDDNPILFIAAVRALIEMPMTLVLTSLPRLSERVCTLLSDPNANMVSQYVALELYPNLSGKVLATMDANKSLGYTEAADSEDDDFDHGTEALDPAMREALEAARNLISTYAPRMFTAIVSVARSRNPLIRAAAGETLQNVLVDDVPADVIFDWFDTIFDLLEQPDNFDRNCMRDVLNRPLEDTPEKADEFDWVCRPNLWRTGYLAAVTNTLASKHAGDTLHRDAARLGRITNYLERQLRSGLRYGSRFTNGVLSAAETFFNVLGPLQLFPPTLVHVAMAAALHHANVTMPEHLPLSFLPAHLRSLPGLDTFEDTDDGCTKTQHPDQSAYRDSVVNGFDLMLRIVLIGTNINVRIAQPFLHDILATIQIAWRSGLLQYGGSGAMYLPQKLGDLISNCMAEPHASRHLGLLIRTLAPEQDWENIETASYLAQSLSSNASAVADINAFAIGVGNECLQGTFDALLHRLESSLNAGIAFEKAYHRAAQRQETQLADGDVADDDTGSQERPADSESGSDSDDDENADQKYDQITVAQTRHNIDVILSQIPSAIGLMLQYARQLAHATGPFHVVMQLVMRLAAEERDSLPDVPNAPRHHRAAQVAMAWYVLKWTPCDTAALPVADFVSLQVATLRDVVDNFSSEEHLHLVHSGFSGINEFLLQVRASEPKEATETSPGADGTKPFKLAASLLGESNLEQLLASCHKFLALREAKTKRGRAAATNVVSLLVTLHRKPLAEDFIGAAAVARLLACILPFLPCKGDPMEAHNVYDGLAQILNFPHVKATNDFDALKHQVTRALRRSKHCKAGVLAQLEAAVGAEEATTNGNAEKIVQLPQLAETESEPSLRRKKTRPERRDN